MSALNPLATKMVHRGECSEVPKTDIERGRQLRPPYAVMRKIFVRQSTVALNACCAQPPFPSLIRLERRRESSTCTIPRLNRRGFFQTRPLENSKPASRGQNRPVPDRANEQIKNLEHSPNLADWAAIKFVLGQPERAKSPAISTVAPRATKNDAARRLTQRHISGHLLCRRLLRVVENDADGVP